MPKLERERLVTYVYPPVAQGVQRVADGLGVTASKCTETLLRWGARALQIEAMRQGANLPLDDLASVWEFLPDWGPLTPSLSVDDEVESYLDGRLQDAKGKLGIAEFTADDLTDAVRRVIRELRAAGEL